MHATYQLIMPLINLSCHLSTCHATYQLIMPLINLSCHLSTYHATYQLVMPLISLSTLIQQQIFSLILSSNYIVHFTSINCSFLFNFNNVFSFIFLNTRNVPITIHKTMVIYHILKKECGMSECCFIP